MDRVFPHTYCTENSKRILFPVLQSAVVESLRLAQNSLLSLLVMITLIDDAGTRSYLPLTDMRFPFNELKRVEKPADENKDAGDSEEEDCDDDESGDDQVEDDGSEEEGSDDDDEEDSDGEVNGNGEGSDDDGEEDEDEDNEDEDDEDDDEDEEEDEEEEAQPPSKRKK